VIYTSNTLPEKRQRSQCRV